MPYRVSLLEKALIPDGAGAGETLANAVALARRAEALGYHRIWFAEHHGFSRMASSSPETLAAFVLAQTRTIRVGSGGVMLQHYAPYKVAETFNTLAALAPGRVDLGVGKAAGGMPLSSRALVQGQTDHDPAAFERKLRELDAFLTPGEGAGAVTARVAPRAAAPPDRILLGASPESAAMAGRLGWGFCYAGHFDSDPERVARSFEVYRAATGASPMYSLVAFAAETSEAAQGLVGPLRLCRVRLPDGQQANLPSLEAAVEFARQAGADSYTTEEIVPNVVSGTAAFVRGALDDLHTRFGVEEFIIDSPVPGFADRMASLEALAPRPAAAATSPTLEEVR